MHFSSYFKTKDLPKLPSYLTSSVGRNQDSSSASSPSSLSMSNLQLGTGRSDLQEQIDFVKEQKQQIPFIHRLVRSRSKNQQQQQQHEPHQPEQPVNHLYFNPFQNAGQPMNFNYSNDSTNDASSSPSPLNSNTTVNPTLSSTSLGSFSSQGSAPRTPPLQQGSSFSSVSSAEISFEMMRQQPLGELMANPIFVGADQASSSTMAKQQPTSPYQVMTAYSMATSPGSSPLHSAMGFPLQYTSGPMSSAGPSSTMLVSGQLPLVPEDLVPYTTSGSGSSTPTMQEMHHPSNSASPPSHALLHAAVVAASVTGNAPSGLPAYALASHPSSSSMHEDMVPVIACASCKRSHIKCDNGRPCQNCLKHPTKAATCRDATPRPRGRPKGGSKIAAEAIARNRQLSTSTVDSTTSWSSGSSNMSASSNYSIHSTENQASLQQYQNGRRTRRHANANRPRQAVENGHQGSFRLQQQQQQQQQQAAAEHQHLMQQQQLFQQHQQQQLNSLPEFPPSFIREPQSSSPFQLTGGPLSNTQEDGSPLSLQSSVEPRQLFVDTELASSAARQHYQNLHLQELNHQHHLQQQQQLQQLFFQQQQQQQQEQQHQQQMTSSLMMTPPMSASPETIRKSAMSSSGLFDSSLLHMQAQQSYQLQGQQPLYDTSSADFDHLMEFGDFQQHQLSQQPNHAHHHQHQQIQQPQLLYPPLNFPNTNC